MRDSHIFFSFKSKKTTYILTIDHIRPKRKRRTATIMIAMIIGMLAPEPTITYTNTERAISKITEEIKVM